MKIWTNNLHLRPLHTHDCDECVFLGRVGLADRRDQSQQDVWVCPRDRSLIMRFGRDGSYSTIHPGFPYSAGHPAHDAIALLESYEMDDKLWAEVPNQAEDVGKVKNTTYVIRQKQEETFALFVVDIIQVDECGKPELERRRFMRMMGKLYDRMHEDETLTDLNITFRGE